MPKTLQQVITEAGHILSNEMGYSAEIVPRSELDDKSEILSHVDGVCLRLSDRLVGSPDYYAQVVVHGGSINTEHDVLRVGLVEVAAGDRVSRYYCGLEPRTVAALLYAQW